MHVHPFPEPDAPELEQYMLYSRAEIAAVLRRIGEERTLVTVYAGADGQFTVSMLLGIDPEFEEAVFDMPVSPEARQLVLDARDLVFVIFFENVKIQFRAPVAQETQFEGRPAFRIRLPAQMLRLQRREYFRVRTPIMGRATCLVPQSRGAEKYESLQVINISVGGLAVMRYPHNFDLPVGEMVQDCFLDLPGVGPVNVSLRVVNVYGDDDSAANGENRRFGCEFVNLAPQARMMVQRYVNRVEAEQRKALGGVR